MLRLLSIRNFVVVEALELELDDGFTVLTGETGAGKSILLDALQLLLGDRFELRQLRPGAERAELAASFDIDQRGDIRHWLSDQGFANEGEAADDGLILRRTLDAQGRSRAWISGRPATLSQLKELGERLIDLHGQHEHQALVALDAQRALLDAYAGLTGLADDVATAWREWKSTIEKHQEAAKTAQTFAAERATLESRRRDLAAMKFDADEWTSLSQAQSRLSHAASLIETSSACEEELGGSDSAAGRLASVAARLRSAATHDGSLHETIAMIESARIQLDEAARALRGYRQKLDVDPRELAQIEQRLSAIHDTARRHRIRPEGIPELLAQTEARLAELEETLDLGLLAKRIADAEASYRALAAKLSSARRTGAQALSTRVTASMQELAMAGGRFEIAFEPLATPASHGFDAIEFRIASHPGQALGSLGRVASGGELSRVALAIQVATSEVAAVPTLIFDEVDAGIGGAVASVVGRLMQGLGCGRQVMCVTHLPQVAAYADTHFRVSKEGASDAVRTAATRLGNAARVDELARMLAGSAITSKARAHAKDLLEQGRREVKPA